jgi:hypothetical protein
VISRSLAAAAAFVALAALTACGSDAPASAGPLSESTERVSVCLLQPPDGRATLGVDVTQNNTTRDVTIKSVRLSRPDGMKLIGAKVMFIPNDSDETLVGFRSGWLPGLTSKESGLRQALTAAPDAVGAVVPGDDSQTVAIVAGVTVEAGGHTGPIKVDYEDDEGRSYTWTGPTSFRTDADRCSS